MADTEVVYESVERASAPDVTAFLNHVLHRTEGGDSWDWLYRHGKGGSVIAIARDNGTIIGSQAMIPIELVHNGKSILTSKSESSYLDPSYRGRQIFERLYEFATEHCKSAGHQLIWGFTSAVKVWKNALHFGLVEPCISDMNLVVTIDEELRAVSGSRLKFAVKRWLVQRQLFRNRWQRLRLAADSNRSKLERRQTLASDVDLRRLYDRVRERYDTRFHLRVDAAYLNWRIHTNPYRAYETAFFYEGAELKGYYLYTVNDRVANLADLTYADEATGTAMVDILLEELESRGLLRCYYFGNYNNALNRRTFDLFVALGGVRTASAWANLVLNDNLGYGADGLYESRYWYINGLWTEGTSI